MQIIPINTSNINGTTVQTVNARELHAWLGSKQDFSTWIKSRIEQYGFVEGIDFTVHKIVDSGSRGQPTIDYHITIEMAKELSMVERTEKGKQARQYFIECERKAKALPVLSGAKLLAAIAAQAAEQEERVGALENKVKLIEATLPREQDYFTVIGWSRYIGITISNSEALGLGRKCAKYSRERGVSIGDTTDPRYGLVHTYHSDICDAAFTDYFDAKAA